MTRDKHIGIFDSGYGGLTVFKEIKKVLPGYSYMYLGDNSRAPYGSKSFETVYRYTLECVEWLISKGCKLIILACNTASARALRSIQQHDLQKYNGTVRVLGVIRPTAEIIGFESRSKEIGIVATEGTVSSKTYEIEIHNFFPDTKIYQQACKLWVPLIESGITDNEEIDLIVRKDLESLLRQSDAIDTVLLGCTHYPLIAPTIRKYLPEHIRIIEQGTIIADSLADYLLRHPEIGNKLIDTPRVQFYTTDDPALFAEKGSYFYGEDIVAKQVKEITQ